MNNTDISKFSTDFDDYSDNLLLTLKEACAIALRSRVSLYRDRKEGRLTFTKVGGSTRIRMGDLRALIGSK